MFSVEIWRTMFDSFAQEDLKSFRLVNRFFRAQVAAYFELRYRQSYQADYLALLEIYTQRLQVLLQGSSLFLDEAYLTLAIGLLKLHPDEALRQEEALKNLLKFLQTLTPRFLSTRKTVFKDYVNRILEIFPLEHSCWKVNELEKIRESIEKQIYRPKVTQELEAEITSAVKRSYPESIQEVLENLRYNQERIYKYVDDSAQQHEFLEAHRLTWGLYFKGLLTDAWGMRVKNDYWRRIWNLERETEAQQRVIAESLQAMMYQLNDFEQHDTGVFLLKELIEPYARDKGNLALMNSYFLRLALELEKHRTTKTRLSIAEQLQNQLRTMRLKLQEAIQFILLSRMGWVQEVFALEQEWNKTLKEFTHVLFEISFQFVGHSFKPFTVFLLGSLSLNGATPYSDVEYGLLLSSTNDANDNDYLNRFLECFHVLVELVGEYAIPHTGYHIDKGMHPLTTLTGDDHGEERLKGSIEQITKELNSKLHPLTGTINNALCHPCLVFTTDNSPTNHNQSPEFFETFKTAIRSQGEQIYGFEQITWREVRALAHLQGMLKEATEDNPGKNKKAWLFADNQVIPQRFNIKAAYALIKYWLMDITNFHGLNYDSVQQALKALAKNHLHPEFVMEIERALATVICIRYRAQFKARQQQGQEWVCLSTYGEKQAGDYELSAKNENHEAKAWREAYLTIIQPCYLLLELWGLKDCEWKENSGNKSKTLEIINQFKQIQSLDIMQILLENLISLFQIIAITTMNPTPLTPLDTRSLQSIAAIQQSRWQREHQPTEQSWMERHFKIYQCLPTILQKKYEYSLLQIIDVNSPSRNWVTQLKVWQYLENPYPNISQELQQILNSYLLHCLQQNSFHPERHWDKLPFEVQEELLEIFEVAKIPFNTCYHLKHRLQPNGESYQRQLEQQTWEKDLKKIFIAEQEYQTEKLVSPQIKILPTIRIQRYDAKKGILEFYLHPKVIEQLLTQGKLSNTGELAPPKNLQHGRHQMLSIDVTIKAKRCRLHIKIYPERPGGELMSNRLSWRLGCRAPWVECMAWVKPNQEKNSKEEVIPILVMETIGEGQNLADEMEVNKTKNCEQEWAANITSKNLTRQILRTLMIAQSDGKFDNYVREKHEYAEDKFEYLWVAIDNERAFWPYRVYLPSQSWLPLCQDIHFVLEDFYSRELDKQVLTEFCQLNSEATLNAWLEEIAEIDGTFEKLFPKEYANPPKASKGEWENKLQLFAKKIKLPSLLAIPLLQSNLKTLVKRFKALQEFIQKSITKQVTITGFDCLQAIEPSFASYLNEIRKQYLSSQKSLSLPQRFEQLFTEGYSQRKTKTMGQMTYQTGEGDLLEQEAEIHQDMRSYQLRFTQNNLQSQNALLAWKASDESCKQQEVWVLQSDTNYTAYALTMQRKTLTVQWSIQATPSIIQKMFAGEILSARQNYLVLTSDEKIQLFTWLLPQLKYTNLVAWQKTLLHTLKVDINKFLQELKEWQPSKTLPAYIIHQLLQAWCETTARNVKSWQDLNWQTFSKKAQQSVLNELMNTKQSVQLLHLHGMRVLSLTKLWELLGKHPLVHTLNISHCTDENIVKKLFDNPVLLQGGRGLLQVPGLLRVHAKSLNPKEAFNNYPIQVAQNPNFTSRSSIEYLELSECKQLTLLKLSLPNLKVLKLKNNWALTELILLNIKKLRRLDLEDCRTLAEKWTDETTETYLKTYSELQQVRWPRKEDNAIHQVSKDGKTRLILLAQKEYIYLVKWLCKQGVDLEARDHYGQTALMVVADRGYLDIAKYLIKIAKANIHAEDNNGNTAFSLAVEKGHNKMAAYLYQQAPNLIDKPRKLDKRTPLMLAAAIGYIVLVKWLCGKEVQVEKQDSKGWNALMVVAGRGHLDIAKYLIKIAKANIHAQDNNGWNALMHATSEGHINMVKYLVETAKANIEAENSWGETALMMAAIKGFKKIISYLLEQGASLIHYNKNGFIALGLARNSDNWESHSALWCRVGPAWTKDDVPYILLHKAVNNSADLNTIQLLLEAGSSHYDKNTYGETPLDIAQMYNEQEVINCLQSYSYQFSNILRFFSGKYKHEAFTQLPIQNFVALSSVNKRHYQFFQPLLLEESTKNTDEQNTSTKDNLVKSL